MFGAQVGAVLPHATLVLPPPVLAAFLWKKRLSTNTVAVAVTGSFVSNMICAKCVLPARAEKLESGML